MSGAPEIPAPDLRAKGLVKSYRTGRIEAQVLKGVDFAARHGDVTMVMGPSGSGKSTLVAALSGPDAARRGRGDGARPEPLETVARQDRQVSPRPLRLHLPGLQPVRRPHRLAAGDYGAEIHRPWRRGGAEHRGAGARRSRPVQAPSPSPERTFRRGEAARGHRPAPSPSARSCCSPTSRPRPSTARTARSSSACCNGRPRNRARR